MKVNFTWKNPPVNRTLYFKDIPLNSDFKIVSESSQGAVYRKVYIDSTGNYGAMEEFSGKVFKTTVSPVELVTVTVNIESEKPVIYPN